MLDTPPGCTGPKQPTGRHSPHWAAGCPAQPTALYSQVDPLRSGPAAMMSLGGDSATQPRCRARRWAGVNSAGHSGAAQQPCPASQRQRGMCTPSAGMQKGGASQSSISEDLCIPGRCAATPSAWSLL